MPPDAIDELEAIHHRHSQIGNEHIGDVGLQAPQRIRRRSGRADMRAGRLQDLGHEVQGICLVIDREHMNVAEISSHRLLCACGCSWMNPGKIVVDGMHDHERDFHSERGALIEAATEHVDGPTVHFDELPRNGQTQTEPAAFTSDPGVRLAESLEDMGQEFRGNPNPGVAHRDFKVGIDPLEPDLNLAVPVRELHGIRQQIPQHLLQPLRVPRDGRRVRIDDRLDA